MLVVVCFCVFVFCVLCFVFCVLCFVFCVVFKQPFSHWRGRKLISAESKWPTCGLW
jgi:hypothetical protein